jgi:serine/threonine-protein kinase HipA
MSQPCWSCLRDVTGEGCYHPQCLLRLFGTERVPCIEVELVRLHTFALAMVGHASLSGVQRKILLQLDTARNTLQVAISGGFYILKPQAQAFPSLPENEHVTMLMAERWGLEVPPLALVELADGSVAYLMQRFDRRQEGGKRRQEDFCQLAGLSPKEKYDGSAELCVRLVRRFASEPLVEVLKLYRLLVFCWWTGNGDMHLKNFSLLAGEDGLHRLSPVYDLLCTRLVIEDDPLALSVGGNKERLTRGRWLRFAEYCQLPPKAAERVLGTAATALPECLDLLQRCALPEDMKARYAELLRERTAVLGG